MLGFMNSAQPTLLRDRRLDRDTHDNVVLLSFFGTMIGNTDMHLGNLSFSASDDFQTFTLTPAYDMLPMILAPTDRGELVAREARLGVPASDHLPIWERARGLAWQYWSSIMSDERLSPDFKESARRLSRGIFQAADRINPRADEEQGLHQGRFERAVQRYAQAQASAQGWTVEAGRIFKVDAGELRMAASWEEILDDASPTPEIRQELVKGSLAVAQVDRLDCGDSGLGLNG